MATPLAGRGSFSFLNLLRLDSISEYLRRLYLALCSAESCWCALRDPILFFTQLKTAAIIAGECPIEAFVVGRFLGALVGFAAADGVGAPPQGLSPAPASPGAVRGLNAAVQRMCTRARMWVSSTQGGAEA